MFSDQNLIWVDMEMTGLDPDSDVVIEIATIVTDSELNTLAEGPVLAIYQLDERLDAMDEWNTSHHTSSGLVKRVRCSDEDENTASHKTIEFLKQYVPEGASPMCGNSICQDRRFMARHMPELERYFHYRNLDVSTLKILVQRRGLQQVQHAPGARRYPGVDRRIALLPGNLHSTLSPGVGRVRSAPLSAVLLQRPAHVFADHLRRKV